MRAGILTFHNAHNYGAVLQAYALREAIRSLGISCDIINYRNDAIEAQYGIELKHRELYLTKNLKLIIDNVLWNLDIKNMTPSWQLQFHSFECFINNILLENHSFKYSLLDVSHSHYDALIVGSDQIWNGNLTGGYDPVYFLDFDYDGRKIAYGASTSLGSVKEQDRSFFKRCLDDFDSISVREKELANDLQKSLGIDATTVIDPSFLLDVRDYENLIYKGRLHKTPYIFVYYVIEDAELRKFSKRVSEKLGCEILELHYYKRFWMKDDNQIADIGPDKFLWYIKNAEAVCTNSFHGVVFSILYRKKFFTTAHGNVRINNLLSLAEPYLDVSPLRDERTIFLQLNKKSYKTSTFVEKERKKSFSFLKRALFE